MTELSGYRKRFDELFAKCDEESLKKVLELLFSLKGYKNYLEEEVPTNVDRLKEVNRLFYRTFEEFVKANDFGLDHQGLFRSSLSRTRNMILNKFEYFSDNDLVSNVTKIGMYMTSKIDEYMKRINKKKDKMIVSRFMNEKSL